MELFSYAIVGWIYLSLCLLRFRFSFLYLLWMTLLRVRQFLLKLNIFETSNLMHTLSQTFMVTFLSKKKAFTRNQHEENITKMCGGVLYAYVNLLFAFSIAKTSFFFSLPLYTLWILFFGPILKKETMRPAPPTKLDCTRTPRLCVDFSFGFMCVVISIFPLRLFSCTQKKNTTTAIFFLLLYSFRALCYFKFFFFSHIHRCRRDHV